MSSETQSVMTNVACGCGRSKLSSAHNLCDLCRKELAQAFWDMYCPRCNKSPETGHLNHK